MEFSSTLNTRTIALIAVLTCLVVSSSANALTLAKNSKTIYTIVIATDAISSEKTAAKELQKHLKLVTGAQLPIRTESHVKPNAPQIAIGQSKRVKLLLPKTDWKSLGSDGIIMKTVGNTIVLTGGRPRGSLYAVYSFLEDIVGCRWWTPTESFIPKKPTLDIPNLNTTYIPKIKCREASYRNPNWSGVFASKLKLNGHWYSIAPEYGGHYSIIGWCHTFYELIPPAKYFAQHPEWFSEVGGKRRDTNAQLCLSNEEMRKELTRNAFELIRKDPTAGIISISQNDANGQCECPKCKAIEAEEGSPSGPVIRFVNAVAEDIEKEYPDFLVETLAYTYTRKSPSLAKPRHNVLIRLCSIEADFARPLDSPANAGFRDDVLTWSSIAPNLYIWNYTANFRDFIMPHPTTQTLGEDIRFFAKHNVVGVFEQGDAANEAGDFGKLKAWMLAHMLWNPTADEAKLINTFMNGYYGPAAPYLAKYLDLIHDAVLKRNQSLSCFNRDFSYLGIEEMNQATRLFDQAADSVKNSPILTTRVRAERLPLDHAWLLRYAILKRLSVSNNLPFLGPKNNLAACEGFITAAKKYKTLYIAEGQSIETYEPKLRLLCQAPPAEFKNIPDTDYADIQENLFTYWWSGEFSMIVDDPSASNGKAGKSPGNHTKWALQWPVTTDVTGKWHCYVIARCESKQNTGNAFDIGIWDETNSQGLAKITVPLETDANKPYKTYDLGIHQLNPGTYFYFAPNGDGTTYEAFYIDRIFLVKEK